MKLASIFSFAIGLFLLSFCKNSGLSYSDVAGSYKVQMQVDTTSFGDGSEMAMGLMSMMEISMNFTKDGKVIYKAGMGAMANEQTIPYTLKGDSLFLEKENGSEGYKVEKNKNGLRLLSKDVNLILTLND